MQSPVSTSCCRIFRHIIDTPIYFWMVSGGKKLGRSSSRITASQKQVRIKCYKKIGVLRHMRARKRTLPYRTWNAPGLEKRSTLEGACVIDQGFEAYLKQERRVLGVGAQEWNLGQQFANCDTEPFLRLPTLFQQSRQKSIHLHVLQPVLRCDKRVKCVSQKLKKLLPFKKRRIPVVNHFDGRFECGDKTTMDPNTASKSTGGPGNTTSGGKRQSQESRQIDLIWRTLDFDILDTRYGYMSFGGVYK